MTEDRTRRVFEQPDDALAFYADLTYFTGTENEVIMQFYDIVPAVPNPEGKIETVRTRLRATIIVSRAHAVKIYRALGRHFGGTQEDLTAQSPDSSKGA